MPDNKTHLATF